MSTAVTPAPPPPAPATGGEQVTTLEFFPGGTAQFLDVLARPQGRIYYRDERVTIVTPSYVHERGVVDLGVVVEAIAEELDIGFRAASSTLYRRGDLARGAMPDRSYYFENRHAIRLTPRGHVDVEAGPPPDLVVEVVWTHRADDVLEIYRDLGIPEVWLYDIPTANLQFLHLGAAGAYEPRPRGRCLPFVSPGEVLDQIRSIDPNEDDQRWRRRVRTWARDVLGPRRNDG